MDLALRPQLSSCSCNPLDGKIMKRNEHFTAEGGRKFYSNGAILIPADDQNPLLGSCFPITHHSSKCACVFMREGGGVEEQIQREQDEYLSTAHVDPVAS